MLFFGFLFTIIAITLALCLSFVRPKKSMNLSPLGNFEKIVTGTAKLLHNF